MGADYRIVFRLPEMGLYDGVVFALLFRLAVRFVQFQAALHAVFRVKRGGGIAQLLPRKAGVVGERVKQRVFAQYAVFAFGAQRHGQTIYSVA